MEEIQTVNSEKIAFEYQEQSSPTARLYSSDFEDCDGGNVIEKFSLKICHRLGDFGRDRDGMRQTCQDGKT